MYIVWRRRAIRTNRRTELFIETAGGRKLGAELTGCPWKPLYCDHTGDGRVAWTPVLMHAERVNGKPTQKLLRRLPTIRSCCIDDPFMRAAWWHEIDTLLDVLEREGTGPEAVYLRRDKRTVLARLREVVPPPTPAAVRAFRAYRRRRQAEQDRANAAAEQALRQAEEDRRREEARRQAEARARRAEEARRRAEEADRVARESRVDPGTLDCWAVLGLPRTATADQVKARYRALALRHHPDRGGDAEAFKRIHRAYEEAGSILST